MLERRSNERIVHAAIEIKSWAMEVPSVCDLRPGTCPGCGAAGAPLGERVVIVGHGLRKRSVIGPLDHRGGIGQAIVLQVRRYRCRACAAVLTVVPRGVLLGRRYGAFAIAWALALFGLLGLPVTAVRERVTSWRAEPHTSNLAWASLSRWARALRDRVLFPSLPRPAPTATLRRIAERAAMALAAEAPPERSVLGPDEKAGYGGLVISARPMAA